jgi:hypothetical protein
VVSVAGQEETGGLDPASEHGDAVADRQPRCDSRLALVFVVTAATTSLLIFRFGPTDG